jgi:hypothetical protein
MADKRMSTADTILQRFGLHPPSTAPGRYYTTCPKCSAARTRAHQKSECLGITIDDQGVQFGCNHCEFKGGALYRTNGADPFVATYDYFDEDGKFLFQVCRTSEKNFPQRRPDGNGGWIWNTQGVRKVLFHLNEVTEAIASKHAVLIVEGEKDVLSLARIGLAATCNPGGASEPGKKTKWRKEFSKALSGADIIILPDHDPAGYAHADAIAGISSGLAKSVRILKLADHWSDCPKGGDVSNWLEAGHTREQLDALIDQTPAYDPAAPQEEPKTDSHKGNGAAPPLLEPWPIERVLEVFTRWLIFALDEDKSPNLTPVYAVLGTIAANLLPGDPVWLGLVAPPSSAKTEILNSVSTLPYVYQAATLTPAALLSGVPKKQHHKTAVGGLLRQIGEFGIISLKDFGSILSMRQDAKAEVLAALREVYDGAWTRLLGTEGGRTLSWSGKVGLVFGCTGVIDGHYSVIGAMGDRFLLSRLAPGEGQFGCALRHSGTATGQMRKELAEAVAHLFARERPAPRPLIEGGEEFQRLDRVVSLVVRLRGAIERDRRTMEIEAIYGAEDTARIGLTLERLLAGLDVLGVERELALDVVEAVAKDSVPPLRRRAYEYLQSLGCHASTAAVAKVLGLPTVTVRRGLEDLAAYQLVERTVQGQGKPDLWRPL